MIHDIKFAFRQLLKTPAFTFTAGNPAKGPALLLMNGNTPSDRDTSDAGGRAARTARLRLLAKDTVAVDTAIVSATSSYRGRTLGSVTFVLVFTRQ